MRLSVDIGGTFTDLVVQNEDERFELFKSPTKPDDPVQGVLDVLAKIDQYVLGSLKPDAPNPAHLHARDLYWIADL